MTSKSSVMMNIMKEITITIMIWMMPDDHILHYHFFFVGENDVRLT